MNKIQELRTFHETYNKHMGEVCLTCLKGLEKLSKQAVLDLLNVIPFTPQEIAESEVVLSSNVIKAIQDKVNWDRVNKIIVDSIHSYIDLPKELKPKAYIECIDDISYITEPIEAERIMRIKNEYRRSKNIANLIIGDETKKKGFLVYNPININKKNLKSFLDYPNLFIHSFVKLEILKEIITKDIRYLAYTYPRSVVTRFKTIDQVPEEVIQMFKEIDSKLGLDSAKLDYTLINTDPNKIFEMEVFLSPFGIKGRISSGDIGFLYGNSGIKPRQYSKFYYSGEIVEVLGYHEP